MTRPPISMPMLGISSVYFFQFFITHTQPGSPRPKIVKHGRRYTEVTPTLHRHNLDHRGPGCDRHTTDAAPRQRPPYTDTTLSTEAQDCEETRGRRYTEATPTLRRHNLDHRGPSCDKHTTDAAPRQRPPYTDTTLSTEAQDCEETRGRHATPKIQM